MPKTVDAVFFRRCNFLRGIFCVYITWLCLIKNLTPREEKSAGRNKTVWGITRASWPWESNKKFAKVVYVPGMFQVFARLCC
jgi:hypothetical protein